MQGSFQYYTYHVFHKTGRLTKYAKPNLPRNTRRTCIVVYVYMYMYLLTSPLQWSFGVVLWEIMTLGKIPYEEVPPEEMLSMLTAGHRLTQPKNCPDDL